MKQIKNSKKRAPERGGAGVKFLFVFIIIGLIAHAGYNYIPIAYQGENFKQDMGTAVVQGATMPSPQGKPKEMVIKKIQSAIRSNELPYDTYLNVNENKQVITARVYYKKQVPILPFGLYNYEYVFDNSISPGSFLD